MIRIVTYATVYIERMLNIWERKILRRIFGIVCENRCWRIRNNVGFHQIVNKNCVFYVRENSLWWLGHSGRFQKSCWKRKREGAIEINILDSEGWDLCKSGRIWIKHAQEKEEWSRIVEEIQALLGPQRQGLNNTRIWNTKTRAYLHIHLRTQLKKIHKTEKKIRKALIPVNRFSSYLEFRFHINFLLKLQDYSKSYSSFVLIFQILFVTGMLWPLEGMHPSIKLLSWIAPCTFSTQSLRSLSIRGWDLTNREVYLGFISSCLWMLVSTLIIYLQIRRNKAKSFL